MRSHATLLGVLFSFAIVDCTSAASLSSSAKNDAGTSDGAGQPPISDCDGAIASGILGIWQTVEIGGGDLPDGSTTAEVIATWRFCGNGASGLYEYSEDGFHTPGRNCHRVEKDRGNFSYFGDRLTLTRVDGSLAFTGCDDASDNSDDLLPIPSTRNFPAHIVGDQLTIEDGSVSDGHRGTTFTRK